MTKDGVSLVIEDDEVRPVAEDDEGRLAAEGPGWALASPDRRASAAGAAVLRAGGNAVDAALATAAMLAVVYPHQCSVGGDAIALVGTPDGTVHTINGSGRAALTVDPVALRARHRVMPETGPTPVTVPGVLAAWTEIAARWGSRPLGAALREAAAAASDGVEVAPGLARELVRERRQLALDAGTAGVFLTADGPLPVGATLRQPRLARTLTELADDPAAIYTGTVAEAIVRRLRELGSALTMDDFAAHRTVIEPPHAVRFGDEEYLSAGANSQGVFFLAGLRALDAVQDRLGHRLDPLGPDAGVVAEVFRLIARDRDRLLADPGDDPDPAALSDWLLSDQRASEKADLAMNFNHRTTDDPAVAASGAGGAGPGPVGRSLSVRRPGDTVAIVAADRHGNWISLIQSLFHAFGSVVLDPVTGVLLHDRGASFSLEPAAAGRLIGGRRPPHTLMPVLVRRNGRLIGAHGTMGGRAQPQIHAQLTLHLVQGATVAAAVAAPRWIVTPAAIRPGHPDPVPLETVQVEADRPDAAHVALLAAGHPLVGISARDDAAGHAQLVRWAGTRFTTATDPRADGAALAG